MSLIQTQIKPSVIQKRFLVALFLFLFLIIMPSFSSVFAQEKAPLVSFNLQDSTADRFSVGIQVLVLLTVLSLAPAIFIMMTSFTRIVVVLSFMRQAFGTQQAPPNQILIGLALFLTFLIMAPVWERVNSEAIQPYLEEKIPQEEALKLAIDPFRVFMLNQVREKDLALFVSISKLPQPKTPADIPTYAVIPAFMISELRKAFQIGFLVYLPFIVIDIVVASVLMSMGMMMLPPVMISLPFKLILFVLADGWFLLVGSLVKGFA